jgi:hypothetical protein
MTPVPKVKVEVDIGRMIAGTWGYSTGQIGAAWLMLLQYYQNERDPSFFENKRARQVLLGMDTRQWNRDRRLILECFLAMQAATAVTFEFGRRNLSASARMFVYERDGGICQYCSAAVLVSDFHCDHVVPVTQGGSNDPDNLVCACPPCNLSKAAKTPDQWRGTA